MGNNLNQLVRAIHRGEVAAQAAQLSQLETLRALLKEIGFQLLGASSTPAADAAASHARRGWPCPPATTSRWFCTQLWLKQQWIDRDHPRFVGCVCRNGSGWVAHPADGKTACSF